MSGSGIRCAICKSAPRSRQITMPLPHHSVFYRPDALPAAQPTASKHWRPDWFYPSGTGLPRFFLEQRPLNGCSSSSLQGWYVVVYIGIFCSGSWSNCRVHLLPSLFFLWFWHSEQVSWLTVSQQNGLCLLYCHLSFSFSFFRTLASLSLFFFSILQWRFFVFFTAGM